MGLGFRVSDLGFRVQGLGFLLVLTIRVPFFGVGNFIRNPETPKKGVKGTTGAHQVAHWGPEVVGGTPRQSFVAKFIKPPEKCKLAVLQGIRVSQESVSFQIYRGLEYPKKV